MKQAIKTLLAAGTLALGLTGALPVQASVVIAGTRVIYSASDTEVTLKLSNEGAAPALTQIWLDKGDPKASPSTIDVPFTLTPPLARIDPGKGQTLRIFYTGEPLPQDKESVFWLNMLEVPPKAGADTNKLQLAFRTRIKLFFRPKGLNGQADEAPSHIRWSVVQNGGRAVLEAHNPTPYHVTFSALELIGGAKTAKSDDGGMVGPGETKTFPLAGEVFQSADAKVRYHAINDFGGPTEGESVLGAQPKK